MITRAYTCDLCGKTIETHPFFAGVGIIRDSGTGNLALAPEAETESHVCAGCLSGLQARPAMCRAGHNCAGGPNCTSDHK